MKTHQSANNASFLAAKVIARLGVSAIGHDGGSSMIGCNQTDRSANWEAPYFPRDA
jgi:hypothetical protein